MKEVSIMEGLMNRLTIAFWLLILGFIVGTVMELYIIVDFNDKELVRKIISRCKEEYVRKTMSINKK